MDVRNGRDTRINSFALVSYLSDPLAAFLERLRAELVPDYHVKAHLTVLPPRPIHVSADQAWSEITEHLQDFPPLSVELDDVAIFRESQVIYLAIKTGGRELEQLNRALNRGSLRFEEPFEYHPHVTVAKDLVFDSVHEAHEIAAKKWKDASVPRHFVMDKLTFVQNTLENGWLDLASIDLVSHVRP